MELEATPRKEPSKWTGCVWGGHNDQRNTKKGGKGRTNVTGTLTWEVGGGERKKRYSRILKSGPTKRPKGGNLEQTQPRVKKTK